MRATEITTYRSLKFFLDQTNEKMQKLELQAATGKRITRPSDDPTAISPVLSARTQIQTSNRYIETIETGLDHIDNMDGYLDSIENIMVRMKEIAIASVNGAMADVDLETYADEVHQLRESLLDAANAQVDGKYLFSGFAEKTQPFSLNPQYDPALYDSTDPATYPVLYNGDSGAKEFEIAPNELIEVNSTGNGFMMGDFDNDGVTDPGASDLFALVTQLEEILRAHNQPATLIAAGPTATTTTNGVAGVTAEVQDLDLSGVTLGNGDSLVFSIDGTDYTYTNNSGASLNDAALAAAVVADLSVANYTLADGGGGILTISQNAGSEADIAPITTSLSTEGPTVKDLIGPLEDAANQVRSQRSYKGNVGRRLETALDHMEQIKIDMEEMRSRYEDADILETITDLQLQQQSFQAALSITGKVSELSILDYI